MEPTRARGHRALPHTADTIIEAWAATRLACLAEAVHALVETYAEPDDAPVTEPITFDLEPAGDEDLLVALLEETLYIVDVFSKIPVAVDVEETEDGGISGCFDVAPVAGVRIVGPAPKAISYSDLSFAHGDDGVWRCRVTIDV